MEENTRPVGLTALAVINFILAFLQIIMTGLTAVLFIFFDKFPSINQNEAQVATIEAIKQLSTGQAIFMLIPLFIAGIILIIAGIGYLKQKKVLGRLMGNIYAAILILTTILSPIILSPAYKRGTFSLIIALAYPVITIALINFVYKKDLVN
jgi:hypothetical protein